MGGPGLDFETWGSTRLRRDTEIGGRPRHELLPCSLQQTRRSVWRISCLAMTASISRAIRAGENELPQRLGRPTRLGCLSEKLFNRNRCRVAGNRLFSLRPCPGRSHGIRLCSRLHKRLCSHLRNRPGRLCCKYGSTRRCSPCSRPRIPRCIRRLAPKVSRTELPCAQRPAPHSAALRAPPAHAEPLPSLAG